MSRVSVGGFKRIAVTALLLLIASQTPGSASGGSAAVADDYKELKFPQLEFKPPTTKRVVLKNGMVLHLLENHELPLVDVVSMIRIGGLYEPVEMRGLASLTGRSWRAGGTKSIKPKNLNSRLEFMGASIETSIGEKSGSISLSIMKKDLDEGLKLLADLIRNPAFDEKGFSVEKNKMLESIKRENDDPSTIAEREFMGQIFPGSVRGIPATVESVERIGRGDVEKYYNDYIGPENFIFGITGDFDSKKIIAKFEKLFKGMPSAEKKLPPEPAYPDDVKPGVYIVDKKLPQTVIRAGHLGINRADPDYHAVVVTNYVIGGGGFSSRLIKDIRSTRGLAYSVWSYFTGGRGDRGVFMVGGETKNESSYELIAASKEIISDVIKNGVTEDELAMAKEAIVNSFVFTFDKDSKIVSSYLRLEYYGMPKDYLETFRDRINEVDMEKVKEVAGKYLHPDRMVILAVGDIKAMGKNMNKLGKVTEIKLKQ
jgi:predicted Zn-dependent peptidase